MSADSLVFHMEQTLWCRSTDHFPKGDTTLPILISKVLAGTPLSTTYIKHTSGVTRTTTCQNMATAAEVAQ